MGDVLFEVREENLETGLRGYPVGYCPTSTVDPTKGLFYSGMSVDSLAFDPPESMIYLLYHGKKGSAKEVQSFKQELQERGKCSSSLLEQIKKLPQALASMKGYAASLLLASSYEGKGNYLEDALNLIAKIPTITATWINTHAGWGNNLPSQPELGYIENFVRILNVPNKNEARLEKAFKLFVNLHFDHGGGNLSAFVGKAVASGLEDLYGSLAAAMCALAGPRHGRANQDCLEFLQELMQQLGESPSEQEVTNILQARLADSKLIFGFGHAVLRVEDPRAAVIFSFLEKEFPEHPLVKMASLLRKSGVAVLKENPKVTSPYPNVDLVSGTLLATSGFNYPEYFTLLFGLARTVGISLQIVYERCIARDGKGTPIVRPKYIYKSRDLSHAST
jgi:citrate synthase